MSALRQTLNDYLALRQAMGFKLSEAQTLLPRFVEFLDRQGATFITTEWAVQWATQPLGGCDRAIPSQYRGRVNWDYGR